MNFNENPQIQLAYQFVQYTNKNIFLTGKAGTGKTTFLHSLKHKTPKRMIVVAPTGVAAINAGGVTIHSFFQLPFHPFIPEEANQNSKEYSQIDFNKTSSSLQFKLRKNKIKIIKSLDLLVIDEISMVRADLLDAVDAVLRQYRNNNTPFGGVQLLMIGDLHQLAPVIKENEWNLIRNYYDTVYFFSSNALKKTNYETIELKKIYRQEDENFINMLGDIRDNKLSENSIKLLNSRYIKSFNPSEKDGYIILTTHNDTASHINKEKHSEIKAKSYKFKAKIEGDFSEYIYPTLESLELKPGAQVMFVKNDSSYDKLYYNGKIGKITKIQDDIIYVKSPDDNYEISVKHERWENVKYKFNESKKSIEENIIGSFEQYPLKLAWAITIHKSQGLTFDKAVIDINAAFAFGQVYVALSRCRTLEGMVLMSEFSKCNIKSDYSIEGFTAKTREKPPDTQNLEESMKEYQKKLIIEQFDLGEIKKRFFFMKKNIKENSGSFDTSISEKFESIQKSAQEHIYLINDRFNIQLLRLFSKNTIPQKDEQLQVRIKKAANYFLDKINSIYINHFKNISIESDNKELSNIIKDSLEKFELAIYVKCRSLNKSLEGFDTIEYIKSIADAELDFKPEFNKDTNKVSVGSGSNNLYVILNAWRKMIASEEEVPVFMVLPQKSLKQLTEKLPEDLKQLSKIKGFGKVKIEQYGQEILEIINDYCMENDISRGNFDFEDLKPEKKAKKPKKNSALISLEMFNSGMQIPEIAKERAYVESTIFGHLLQYVQKGELEANKLISENKLSKISEYIRKCDEYSLNNLYAEANGNYSYNELRLGLVHLKKRLTN